MPSEEFEICYNHIKSQHTVALNWKIWLPAALLPGSIHRVEIPLSLTSDLPGLRESRETDVDFDNAKTRNCGVQNKLRISLRSIIALGQATHKLKCRTTQSFK